MSWSFKEDFVQILFTRRLTDTKIIDANVELHNKKTEDAAYTK